MIKMIEEEKAHQFLMGLNEERYSHIKSQILALEPFPSLGRIFNMILQEEHHRKVMCDRDDRGEPTAAFDVLNTEKPQKAMVEQGSCRHCGRYVYNESTCAMRLSVSHRAGGRETKDRVVVMVDEVEELAVGRAEEQHAKLSMLLLQTRLLMCLQAEAMMRKVREFCLVLLLSKYKAYLVETSKPGYEKLSGNDIWIIDFEASRHMTGNLNALANLENVDAIPIELPDGMLRLVKIHKTVNLGSRITMSKVLYGPNFHCNLISVAQLIRELKCIAMFADELCVIQDSTSRSLIGVGELRGGVYCFNQIAIVKVQAHVVDSCNLWHNRLWHPSNAILSLLPKYLGANIHCNTDSNPCDVCFCAKQIHSTFNVSESNLGLFDERKR